jgi:hypothetical protein
MAAQAYPAAATVAPVLHAHFGRHLEDAKERGRSTLASLPGVSEIAEILDAAFWTSLRHEEGYVSKVSLAFLEPRQAAEPLIFERSIALEPAALAKVAPAVERAGIHLGVWPAGGALRVWGTTATIPAVCFVAEVAAPGLLVIKHHRGEESGKFVNVAVLEGDQIKLVDEQASSLPDCPALITSLLGFDSPASWIDSVNVLVQVAVSMRAHGRGGSMLMVPANSEAWRESIIRPIPYEAAPPFTALADLNRATPEERRSRAWQDALGRAVSAIAGLTAVDGATILSADYDLLGFGAKIARRKGSPLVSVVTVTEPIAGGLPEAVDPAQLGGTRHLSAAQFVHDQRDAIALVASQDRHFTIFAWSPCEDMVHAHRVEVLLM